MQIDGLQAKLRTVAQTSETGGTVVPCYILSYHVYISAFYGLIVARGIIKGLSEDCMLWMEKIGQIQPEICPISVNVALM